MAVEYALACAFTVLAAVSLGQAVAPAVAEYRTSLNQEVVEARALIVELQGACTAPAQ